jgi:glycosyltransferase involved in cell wall biosynthesis
MVIAESFACGTPVLASRIGSLDELVEEGVTGRKFTPGDPDALAAGVRSMLNDEPALGRMRASARRHFEAQLTEQQNFERLMSVYAGVIGGADVDRKRRHA